MKKEVTMLLDIMHIKEIYYPDVVLAPKGPTWRICVNYMDLKEACPIDRFPLPNIDQLVEEMTGYELMSFMDAFKEYHQIFMHKQDAKKIGFTTLKGIFCCLVMPLA